MLCAVSTGAGEFVSKRCACCAHPHGRGKPRSKSGLHKVAAIISHAVLLCFPSTLKVLSPGKPLSGDPGRPNPKLQTVSPEPHIGLGLGFRVLHLHFRFTLCTSPTKIPGNVNCTAEKMRLSRSPFLGLKLSL